MPSGPKPKPTLLKIVGGTEQPSRINEDEPMPPGALMDPPAFMKPRAKAIWKETLENAPEGMIRKLDVGMFAGYCVAFAIYEHAIENVNKNGSIVATRNGQPMKNPFLSIADQQLQIMIKAGSDLGFSPSSRSRVKVPGRKKAKSAFGRLREFKLEE